MRIVDHLSESPLIRGRRPKSRAREKTVSWVHRLRTVFCKSRCEDGTVLVEVALTSMVFIGLVFAVFDFGRLFWVEMAVQNALQDAARYGSTGNHLPNPASPGNNLSRVVSITDTLESEAMGLQLTNIQVSSLNGGSGSAGGPGDMLTVSATVSIQLMAPVLAQLYPNGQYTYTGSITVMNEPFPPSETQ
jgi:hypothetical protein